MKGSPMLIKKKNLSNKIDSRKKKKLFEKGQISIPVAEGQKRSGILYLCCPHWPLLSPEEGGKILRNVGFWVGKKIWSVFKPKPINTYTIRIQLQVIDHWSEITYKMIETVVPQLILKQTNKQTNRQINQRNLTSNKS